MYRRIDDFIAAFTDNANATKKYLAVFTDESLSESVAEGHRTLGRIAWHISQTIVEMAGKTGLSVVGPEETAPVPGSAAEIAAAYSASADSLMEQIQANWKNETLEVEDEMYGSKWSRGFTLHCLMDHETHHRGQMSVLMRRAGLVVPGTMGPAKEEWEQYGMQTPEI